MTNAFLPVASLPAIQRDLFLARMMRRVEDNPSGLSTLEVRWADMVIRFASSESTTAATVEVATTISIVVFSRRMEALLDCGAPTDSAVEWTMKWSARISTYGTVSHVRALLYDRIASLDAETGETVGVLKLKRRSVTAGHAKLRLVPADDDLQVVIRHHSAQGLKALWKSVLWRLKPQHGRPQPAVVDDSPDWERELLTSA